MKMKKWLSILLFCLFTVTAFAQKNEVKVMYSPVSLHRIDNWGKDLDGLNAKFNGTFMVEYNRYVKPRLKLGVNIAYDYKNVSAQKLNAK